ncbi:transglutaminase family protein [Rhodobacter sp. Har01]|uniref:transglutaminase family protein n=1 Tax=Rhodobacter sp. Har01 TaxID=2883999 RepID=UPI001D05D161|nr:transglutaminase family protein [Rhodobacter sp. Har01]MCB6177847.1 transglutaminase family protein [Rhodobacter sp. Har01]
MRLRITHTTTYDYDAPVPYALQQVRLTPKDGPTQEVLAWETRVTGGRKELSFDDAHGNRVDLISFESGTRRISLVIEGEVESRDTAGVIGAEAGFMPLWMFLRATPLTRPGTGCRKMAAQVPPGPPLERCHALMAAVHESLAYETGVSHVGWTAEDTLAAGHGVCQDLAHVFVTVARLLGLPARYVSGYLMMDDRVAQDATHAWAEAHLPELGWVAFDPTHNICPDARYVRIATGLDYSEAAPVTGTRFGRADERLSVAVEVQQMQQ